MSIRLRQFFRRISEAWRMKMRLFTGKSAVVWMRRENRGWKSEKCFWYRIDRSYTLWVHQIKNTYCCSKTASSEEKPRPREIQNELFKVEQYGDGAGVSFERRILWLLRYPI